MKFKVVKNYKVDGVGTEKKSVELKEGDVVELDSVLEAKLLADGIVEKFDGDLDVEIKKQKDKIEVKTMAIEVKAENAKPMEIKEFMGLVKLAGLGDAKAKEKLDIQQKTILGQNETTAADGGYLLQAEVAKQIIDATPSASVIYPKCTRYALAPTSKSISLPSVYDTVHSATAFKGGVRIYKVAEGIDKTPFKQAINTVTIATSKLCAVGYLTDELAMDCPSYESNLIKNVGEAFGEVIDNEILNGTLSVMTATVAHSSVIDAPVAGVHPTAPELIGMYVRAFNPSRCEWYMNSDQYAEVVALGTAGTYVPLFQPNWSVSPNGTLLGRPINIIDYCAASNTVGDILFADFSQYAIVERGTTQFDTSIHVAFVADQTCYRWVRRIGGAPTLLSGVTYPSTVVKGWAVESNH